MQLISIFIVLTLIIVAVILFKANKKPEYGMPEITDNDIWRFSKSKQDYWTKGNLQTKHFLTILLFVLTIINCVGNLYLLMETLGITNLPADNKWARIRDNGILFLVMQLLILGLVFAFRAIRNRLWQSQWEVFGPMSEPDFNQVLQLQTHLSIIDRYLPPYIISGRKIFVFKFLRTPEIDIDRVSSFKVSIHKAVLITIRADRQIVFGVSNLKIAEFLRAAINRINPNAAI